MGVRRNWFIAIILILAVFISSKADTATISSGGGHVIQEEGTPLTQRPAINFTGNTVACQDNSGNNRTDCTIEYGASPTKLYVKGHTYPAEQNYMTVDVNNLSGWSQLIDYYINFASGSSQYISIANESNFDFNYNSAFSLGAWIKTSTSAAQMILGKRETSGNVGYMFRVESSGKLRFYIYSSSSTNLDVLSTPTVNDGNWHHVAVTKSTATTASGITFYIDGVSVSKDTPNSDNLGNNSILNNSNLRIGTDDYAANYFNGSMDSVTISNVEWSLSDVKTLCGWTGSACSSNSLVPVNTSGLVSGFNFSTGSGSTAYDIKGNNNGTLINTPTWSLSGLTCKLGSQCIVFDGSDDFLQVFGYDILPTDSSARSIEAWIYPTSLTNRSVIASYGSDSDNNLFSFELNGWQADQVGADQGKLFIRTRNNALKTTNAVNLNTWSHVVATLDGNTTLGTGAHIWINGSEETLVAAGNMGSSGTINTTVSDNMMIGRGLNRCMVSDTGMNGCLKFDGSNDYVTIADHSDLEPSSSITIMAWIYRTKSDIEQTIIHKYGVAGEREWELRLNSSNALQYLYNGTGVVSTQTIPLNKWTHVAAIEKNIGGSGWSQIFIDGALVAAGSTTGAVPGTRTSPVEIGANTNLGYYFGGSIDGIRVYVGTTPLTRDNVWAAYNFGNGTPCTGSETDIKLCMKFDELSGTTAADIAGTAQNGTLTNFASTTADFDTDGWQDNGYFNGSIDNLLVWNIALSGSSSPTIATRYNSGSGTEDCTSSNIKLCYKFNDTNTNQILASNSATVSGIGSDANACTSTSSPCKTIAGALSKIGSKYFSNNIDVDIATGIYPETVTIEGYHPAGPFNLRLLGHFNSTMNSFTDVPIFKGTSTGSNTNAFPKDARSLFKDTNTTYDWRVNDAFIEITGGTHHSYDVTGTHTGSNNASTLTDSTKSWTINQWIGYIVYNETDKSDCEITANTSTTVTCTLSGGTENDWDTGDVYSISDYDYRNFYPIENYWNKNTLSVVTRWAVAGAGGSTGVGGTITYTIPDTTTNYKVYDPRFMTTIHGGARTYALPTGTAGGTQPIQGRSNNIFVKDSSGISVSKIGLRSTGCPAGSLYPCGHGFMTENTTINEVSAVFGYRIGYSVLSFEKSSYTDKVAKNILTQSYEGGKAYNTTTVNTLINNLTDNTANCSWCNYFSSPISEITYNNWKRVSYACFDLEGNVDSYFYGYNRSDTCGPGGGIESVGSSAINFSYPNVISNASRGIMICCYANITSNLQEGAHVDIEINNSIYGIYAGNNSNIDWGSPAPTSITYSGNVANYLAAGMGIFIENAAPTISSCGTSPSISGNSNIISGTVTTGSTATTACTINFTATWAATPNCVVSMDGNFAPYISALSTTAMTVTYSSATSKKIYYSCMLQ